MNNSYEELIGLYSSPFPCFHCCDPLLMTDFLQTRPPKPTLRVVVQAWLTGARHCTPNRLNRVHVKCIYADIVDSLHMLHGEPVLALDQLNSRALSWVWLLHRITSSQKQRSEFSGQLTWINLQQAGEPWRKSCSRHQLKKKKALRLAFPAKFSKHVRTPEKD